MPRFSSADAYERECNERDAERVRALTEAAMQGILDAVGCRPLPDTLVLNVNAPSGGGATVNIGTKA